METMENLTQYLRDRPVVDRARGPMRLSIRSFGDMFLVYRGRIRRSTGPVFTTRSIDAARAYVAERS